MSLIDLPSETLIQIASYLSYNDINSLSAVNKLFNALQYDLCLWAEKAVADGLVKTRSSFIRSSSNNGLRSKQLYHFLMTSDLYRRVIPFNMPIESEFDSIADTQQTTRFGRQICDIKAFFATIPKTNPSTANPLSRLSTVITVFPFGQTKSFNIVVKRHSTYTTTSPLKVSSPQGHVFTVADLYMLKTLAVAKLPYYTHDLFREIVNCKYKIKNSTITIHTR